MFLVEVLDFLVGVFDHLVFNLEVVDGFRHVVQVLEMRQPAEPFAQGAGVQSLEHQPEAVAGELLGGVPLGGFPAEPVALLRL